MGWFKKKQTADATPPTGRRRPFGAPAIDTAIPRQTPEEKAAAEADALVANTTPVAPPPTSLIASTNVDLARAAAERQRKRTAGGGLLTGSIGAPGPKAKLQQKTLMGS